MCKLSRWKSARKRASQAKVGTPYPRRLAAGLAMFRIAAPETSGRAHEIRDLLTRFNTPFSFHSAT